ncbi:MAG: triose-phosphate isomerase [Candidatus Eremiobacteraeota bacterium]|nr:triose-phosphate isomerase [Candidatus Eremiobacteraeota bacterium]
MRHRRPFFAGNWKMHKTPAQAREYAQAFVPEGEPLVARATIALLAPFVDLESLHQELDGTTIAFGAQNCYWEREGAFTGEISVPMLKELGAAYCIVGHSERRQRFGETDEQVARKVAALLTGEITPIVCVGESLEENREGRTRERVCRQIEDGLGALTDAERAMLVIAYEPIWAIGTGLACEPLAANETARMIREAAGGLSEVRILYGGSMNAENVATFCAQPDIDGGLVGSASLDPRAFARLIANGTQVLDAR